MILAFLMVAQCPDGAPPPCRARPRDENVVAIQQFAYRGPAEHQWLGDGATELVRIALDGLGDWRAVDASGTPRAATIVTGTVMVLGPQLRIALELRQAAGRRLLGSTERRGALGAPGPALDSAAADLARIRFGLPGSRVLRQNLAEYAATNTRALRAYLAAERLTREGRFQESSDSLMAAIGADSSFGLAWYRLYVSMTAFARQPRFLYRWQPAQIALRHARGIPPRERLILETAAAMGQGQRALAIANARVLTERYPDDANALYTAGEVLVHVDLSRDAMERAAVLFESAVAADSALPELYLHAAELLATRDSTKAWRVIERGIQRFPDFRMLYAVRLAMQSVLRGSAEPDEAMMRQRRWWDLVYRAADEEVPRMLARDPRASLEASIRLYTVLGRSEMEPLARLVAASEMAVLDAARGRVARALQRIDSLRPFWPNEPEVDVFTILVTAQHGIRLDRARAALSRLDSLTAGEWQAGAASLASRYGVMARDTAELARSARFFRRFSGAVNQMLADGADGWLALMRGDSAGARRLLDRALAVRTYGWDPKWPERHMALTLAELNLAAGDADGAEQALSLFHLGRDGVLYAAQAEELAARVARARNDPPAERRALMNVVELWENADPELQPRVAAARARLAELR